MLNCQQVDWIAKLKKLLAEQMLGTLGDIASNKGRFSGIEARNADEAKFLRNAEVTFGECTTWMG